ncbi:MAG: biotin synthase [Clostridiales bacterium]|nr:biotin synthase [Clostridiales bacterium]
MAHVILRARPEGVELVNQMALDAAYEVSGDADAEATAIACARGIQAPPGAAKVAKLYLAGRCAFNCAYCGCRAGREGGSRYALEPRALARLAVEAAGGRGVFLSSAICQNADYTQERLAEAARIMREELHYAGYLHAKVMPGADEALIARTGRYASRLSVNIEVAHSAGYAQIARQKSRRLILSPMGAIARQIGEARETRAPFARSQTTQLMAGAIGEDDRTIMTLAGALYGRYRLKRVYYTAFHYEHPAAGYPDLQRRRTPFWRVARLYQADRLIALYGFSPDDVTPRDAAMLEEDIDPKAAWALRHLDLYPIEVNRADYETLLRVPGIGVTYARRIIEARRHCAITHDVLRRMRVSLKRSRYFITCMGRYEGGDMLDAPGLRAALTSAGEQASIARAVADGAPLCEEG